MIICHGIKLIYAHPPKTGGSTITAALRPYVDSIQKPLGHRRNPGIGGWQGDWHAIGWMHQGWASVKGSIQPLLQDNYLMLTTVRNPFYRMASGWEKKGKARGISPHDWLHRPAPGHLVQPVTYFTGNVIDAFIRLEKIHEDWDRFCDLMKFEDPPKLLHVNPGTGKLRDAMREFYADSRCVDFVRKRFGMEFSLFGYSKATRFLY